MWKSVILLILFLNSSFHLLFGQEYKWVQQIKGPVNSARDICIDGYGNAYIVGSFKDSANFDPDSTNFTLTSKNFDCYVSKYSPNGSFLWAFRLGNFNDEIGVSCKSDGSNNLIVSGRFSDTVDFDPGPGIFNCISSTNKLFFAKYDNLSNFLWAKTIEANIFEDNLEVDNANNILITGQFSGTVDFDADTVNSFYLNSIGTDAFLMKYNESGHFKWAKHLRSINNQSSSYTYELRLGESNSIYMTGWFNGDIDFDPSSANYILSSNNHDGFVAKYDSLGNFLWVRKIGGSGLDYCSSISVGIKEKVYVTGSYSGIVDFDPGPDTIYLNENQNGKLFIACYDKYGGFHWASAFCLGPYGWAQKIRLDNQNNIYTYGQFDGVCNFDVGKSESKLSSFNSRDIFVVKYDSLGEFNWAKQLGSSGLDWSYGMEIDQSDNFYLSGIFANWVDFNFGLGNKILNGGNSNSFIAKYGVCSSSDTSISIQICQGEEYIFPSGKKSILPIVDTSVISSKYGCDSLIVTELSVFAINTLVKILGTELKAEYDSASYQWLKCDNSGFKILTNDTLISYHLSNNGNYAVALLSQGCADTSDCIEVTWVKVTNEKYYSRLEIFPNPVKGNNITLKSNAASIRSIRFYNISGKIVFVKSFLHEDFEEIALPQFLENGLYFLRIESMDEILHKKLIIQR